MECPFLTLAPSLARTTTTTAAAAAIRSSSSNNIRGLPQIAPFIIRQQHAFSFSARRLATHDNAAALRNGMVKAGENGTTQAQPLAGYYHDILSTRSPYDRQTVPPRLQSREPAEEPVPPTKKPQTPEEKMAIVFGTRLAGPGRASRYDPGAAPDATWRTVNGVAIPPRPEEPDNCCMSGCVHCVWDDYRDELEEWAARLAQAKAKGSPATSDGKDQRQTPRSEVNAASGSMDDDGGGSETKWTLPDPNEDLFANIPVGIREFMKTEKKLKRKHQEEAHT
ncbi:oxidoreductase-like domain-containing protein [Aspergillus brunneoviolaceus CBS 621.78]|uniref:Uncharacterized protein n=1 Tax=Aspergillus brunneoviolaceus CBS 621.78 TaxID=1450534 RepID=A0ACD1FSU9_9EURO|nr:hypothetical protein BO95DRAFT_448253 [Aspergillus brunneoviolaceus CBS 621.78]RAH40053.1 hypothetical protein BO95DRAFT_448253 [Aspergillus brunneoviolaceus CBS 621.78]